MKKFGLLLPITFVLAQPAYAQNDAAEDLVASKRAANMTYRELMNMFSHALGEIQDGMVRRNEELVKQGANVILTHPAPKSKPWTIMAAPNQDGFKQALLAYDKVLDVHAKATVSAAVDQDWSTGVEALGQLQAACNSCHQEWMNKALR